MTFEKANFVVVILRHFLLFDANNLLFQMSSLKITINCFHPNIIHAIDISECRSEELIIAFLKLSVLLDMITKSHQRFRDYYN